MQDSTYLGTAEPKKLLLKFAIPCICSLIISCLYNIVDQIFVGNGVGYLGNAATGVIFPVTVVGWGVSLFFGDGAAASSFLTQLSIVVITVVNNILLVRYGAASAYGADIPLAAFVVIMKLFQIVLNGAIGIVAGAQPIVGYNYGAGRFDRVRELLGLILKWTAVVCVICTVLFEAVPGVFIRVFGSADDPVYFAFAVSCLRIYLSLILLTCLQKVCAIFMQSIGRARAAVPAPFLPRRPGAVGKNATDRKLCPKTPRIPLQ